MEYKNIIFDIDGTLLDSFDPYMDSLSKTLKDVINYDLDELTKDTFFHMTNEEMFKYLNIDSNSNLALRIKEQNDFYLKELRINLYDGIIELLKNLKKENIFLAINTSRTREETLELDCLRSIIKFFDCVITSDIIKNSKPNRESIDKILNEYNLNRNETIMIGDSVNDSKCASNANVSFALASWGARNKHISYDYYLNSINDIYNLIRKEK